MLYACVERFDVMSVRGNILGWDGEVNKAIYIYVLCFIHARLFSQNMVMNTHAYIYSNGFIPCLFVIMYIIII
jgi:hypothetical protein